MRGIQGGGVEIEDEDDPPSLRSFGATGDEEEGDKFPVVLSGIRLRMFLLLHRAPPFVFCIGAFPGLWRNGGLDSTVRGHLGKSRHGRLPGG